MILLLGGQMAAGQSHYHIRFADMWLYNHCHRYIQFIVVVTENDISLLSEKLGLTFYF